MTIILISGSINAGKTTVTRALAALLPNTAHVEVDALREFVAFLPLAEAIPIVLENAIAVARNLARRQYNVILTYPLGPDDHRALRDAFADLGTPTYTFILSPPLATALTARGPRALTAHERRRIREQYADNRHRPAFGIAIDNSAQTPTETAHLILAHLHAAATKIGQCLPLPSIRHSSFVIRHDREGHNVRTSPLAFRPHTPHGRMPAVGTGIREG